MKYKKTNYEGSPDCLPPELYRDPLPYNKEPLNLTYPYPPYGALTTAVTQSSSPPVANIDITRCRIPYNQPTIQHYTNDFTNVGLDAMHQQPKYTNNNIIHYAAQAYGPPYYHGPN